MTLDNFNGSGNIPVARERLKILVTGLEIIGLAILINLLLIASGPGALLGLALNSNVSTSFSLVGEKEKVLSEGLMR